MARTEIPIVVIDPATGNAVTSANVTVVNRATSANATIYAGETGSTTVANPRVTDSNGRLTGWVERGGYRLDITGSGLTAYSKAWDSAPAADEAIDVDWLPQSNVQQTVKTTAFSTTSTSFTDVTGLSVAITPRATTSKVLVTVSIYTSNSASALNTFNLLRGSTNLAQPSADTYSGSMNASVGTAIDQTVSLTFLDSPATTAATTYKIQMKVSSGTGYVCRRGDLASVSAASVITAQEITI